MGKNQCPRPTVKGLSAGEGQPETGPLTPALALTPSLAFRKSLHVTVPCFPHLWNDDSSTDGHSREEGQRGVTLDPSRKEALVK